MATRPSQKLPREIYQRIRADTGLSQRELARLAGIGLQELKSIERGKSPLRMPTAFRYYLATGINRYALVERKELKFEAGNPNRAWQAEVASRRHVVSEFEAAVRCFLDATLKKAKSDPKSATLYPLLLTELMLCLARFRHHTEINRTGKKGKKPASQTAKWCEPKSCDCPEWTHQLLRATSLPDIIKAFQDERLILGSELPANSGAVAAG
jgi:transcriptional regulator with XRE-family HTH domain